ncbi:C4-dicarboxylate ABC transporter substrate-binding protein [Oscillospiraceae bacterium]|nr:C4-dicarboxylate ABC transporter substrate-binding protein [Oscillospiraceae bacterium]BDF76456.1 C4-dicarboxylate ABC transporter substrate-binding protein [Oscillospiraceae bacterium]
MKRILALALSFAMLLGVAACGDKAGTAQPSQSPAVQPSAGQDAPPAAPADQVVIQIGHPDPEGENSRFDYTIKKINEKLQESCGGHFYFQAVPNGQLGTETDMLNGCSDGSVQAAMLSVDTFSNQIPMLQLFSMPYLTNYYEQCFILLDDPDFMQTTRDTFAQEWNIQVLGGYMYNGPRMLASVKPIRSLEDCKDVLVRITTNQIAQKTWEALGAIPTVVAFSECYTAFSQGVVDAIDCPVETQYICAFYEPAKYLCFTDEYDVLSIPLMNMDLYYSLTEEERGWIDEAFEYGVQMERSRILESMDEVTRYMTDGTVASLERCDIDRTQFQTATLSVHEEYYSILGGELFDWAYEKLDEDNAAKGLPLWRDLAAWSDYAKG